MTPLFWFHQHVIFCKKALKKGPSQGHQLADPHRVVNRMNRAATTDLHLQTLQDLHNQLHVICHSQEPILPNTLNKSNSKQHLPKVCQAIYGKISFLPYFLYPLYLYVIPNLLNAHQQNENCRHKGELSSADPHATVLHDCLCHLEHESITVGFAHQQQQQQQQKHVSIVQHKQHIIIHTWLSKSRSNWTNAALYFLVNYNKQPGPWLLFVCVSQFVTKWVTNVCRMS